MATESLFLNAPEHRTVPSGEVIYAEGDAGTHMFGIVSGSVALRKGGVVVANLGPEDVFGERALIDHLPRNLTAVATSETTLAEIDRRLFLFLVHESSTFALGIMKALASRLRNYDELFGDAAVATPGQDANGATAASGG
jgi:CRP-like cAMP-binding protein